jgi:hypothetical protein
MGDEEFRAFMRDLLARMPPRAFDPELLERAVGYPWARPGGSYRLTDARVELLADATADDREGIVDRLTSADGGRSPLLAFGSNAAPEVLERKFAHFPDRVDREVLVLTGDLHDFDVGVSAHLTMYGSMPATLFPSPGTRVSAAILWVTPTQFVQLTWTEISYRLGRLRARFDVDRDDECFEEVFAFVSRFGAFCPKGAPVALAAVPAARRTAEALTQEQLLDAAAGLAIEPGAKAEALVRALFEDPTAIVPKLAEAVHRASQPFESERWTPYECG